MMFKKKEVEPELPYNVKLKVPLDTQYIARLTITLTSICLVVALLLGFVNYTTEPIIAAATAEKKAAAMEQVLLAEEYAPVSGLAEGGAVSALYQAMDGGAQIGYVAEVTSNGFGGAIDMVVGVDMAGFVTGVSVIDDGETQGVGSKVVKDAKVLERFIGLGAPITVNEGANRFDAVSGATVSSKAVTAGVNAVLDAVGNAG